MSGTNCSPGKEYHLKEYELLRTEIIELVEHTRKLEIYAVGATAAFYAWFFNTRPVTLALLIPIALALLGGFRSYAALLRIQEIAAYLRRIEEKFALDDIELVGWETYRKRRLDRLRVRFSIYVAPFFSSAALFWLILAFVSALLWCFPESLEKAQTGGPISSSPSSVVIFLADVDDH